MATKAIATRADGGINEMTEISHPLIREYADRCQADFIILDDPKGLHPHYRILQFYDLFKKYNRILSLDSDILIAKDCPDLFSIVPKNKIGSVFEDKGTRQNDRRERIKKAQKRFGEIKWHQGYINTSVAVFSKQHRKIFKQRELWMENGYDDIYLGYWAKKFGFEFYELSYQFNHMRCFSEPWNGSPSRFDSYIIHYAGGGFQEPREQEIREDFQKWKYLGRL